MASPTPTAPARGAPGQGEARSDEATLPWVAHGIEAGLLGAFVVAAFFGVVDWLAGRPLWTPHALGSALFLGELPAPGSPLQPVLVLAYSALHGAVFIAFGLPAAFRTLAAPAPPRALPGMALLAAALFVGFELVFLSLGELFLPGLLGLLGAGRVALANACAAAAMAGFLSLRAARRAGAPSSAGRGSPLDPPPLRPTGR